MPIYELVPINQNDPDWRDSSHKGPCVVRAGNEHYARLAATLAFVAATKIEPGAAMPISPWNQEDKVKVYLVTKHSINEDGPQVVLAPAGYHPSLEDKDGKLVD